VISAGTDVSGLVQKWTERKEKITTTTMNKKKITKQIHNKI
jgi:hypothetical protein